MIWVVCIVADRLPTLLGGILRSTPNPTRGRTRREKISVKKITALRFRLRER